MHSHLCCQDPPFLSATFQSFPRSFPFPFGWFWYKRIIGFGRDPKGKRASPTVIPSVATKPPAPFFIRAAHLRPRQRRERTASARQMVSFDFIWCWNERISPHCQQPVWGTVDSIRMVQHPVLQNVGTNTLARRCTHDRSLTMLENAFRRNRDRFPMEIRHAAVGPVARIANSQEPVRFFLKIRQTDIACVLSAVMSKILIWKKSAFSEIFYCTIPGTTPDFFLYVIARFSYFANLHGTPKIRDTYIESNAAFFRDVMDIPGFAVRNAICNTYSR